MRQTEDSRHDLEHTQSALSTGLEACRAVVRNYRRLIADEAGGVPGHLPADNDQRDSANDRA